MAFVKWNWASHPQPSPAALDALLDGWREKTLPKSGSEDFRGHLGWVSTAVRRWLDTFPEGAEIGTGDLMRAFVPGQGAEFYQFFANRIGNCRYFGYLDGYWDDASNRRQPTKPHKKYHRGELT